MARVLVIEDDASLRLVARIVLERRGHEVTESQGAADALASLREGVTNPDVVLVDMRMPYMSGLEFIRELRSDRRLHTVPVVLLTGDLDARGKAPDGVRVVLKPFEPAALLSVVDDLTHPLEGDFVGV